MRQLISGLLIALSLLGGTCRGEEYAQIAANAFDADIKVYSVQNAVDRRGYLEKTRLSIGTILKSHHFNRDGYNETHNGFYLNIDRWSVGSYLNSGYEQSMFVTYNPRLYASRALDVSLVAGVANGYDGWEYAQNGYLPIVGVSAQWTYLKAMLSFDVVAVGLELPLN